MSARVNCATDWVAYPGTLQMLTPNSLAASRSMISVPVAATATSFSSFAELKTARSMTTLLVTTTECPINLSQVSEGLVTWWTVQSHWSIQLCREISPYVAASRNTIFSRFMSGSFRDPRALLLHPINGPLLPKTKSSGLFPDRAIAFQYG